MVLGCENLWPVGFVRSSGPGIWGSVPSERWITVVLRFIVMDGLSTMRILGWV